MKIHSLKLLAQIAEELRRGGCKVVLASGCFDILHVGHIKHLEAAKKLGNVLMVVATSDEGVCREKGKGRPVFKLRERLHALAALNCVDYVAANVDKVAEAVWMIRPAVYAKGQEYKKNMTPQLEEEKVAVEEVGGRLVFTDTAECHSTDVLNQLGVKHG